MHRNYRFNTGRLVLVLVENDLKDKYCLLNDAKNAKLKCLHLECGVFQIWIELRQALGVQGDHDVLRSRDACEWQISQSSE